MATKKNTRHLIIGLIVLSLVGSCSIRKLEKKGVYQEAEPIVFNQYVQDSNVNIIDVRTKEEYEKSHIPGAVNASYFSGHFSRLVKELNLDKSKIILIYCETQHRSLFATKKLYLLGFKRIIDLDRGMMYWRKKEFPTVYPNQN